MSIRTWLAAKFPPVLPPGVNPPEPPNSRRPPPPLGSRPRPRTSAEVTRAEDEALAVLFDLMQKLTKVNLMPRCAEHIVAISDLLWSYRGRRHVFGDLKPKADESKPNP
jgi:hypothetical protein